MSSTQTSEVETQTKDNKISDVEKYTYIIAIIIASIGAINWGLTLIQINIVSIIPNKNVRKVIYFIIGIAGFIALFSAVKWHLRK